MSIPEYDQRPPADPNRDLVPRPRAGQAGLPEDPFAAEPLDGGLPDDLSAAAREQRAQWRTRSRVRSAVRAIYFAAFPALRRTRSPA